MSGACFSGDERGLSLRPAARARTPPAGVRQPAAVLGRADPGRAPRRAAAGGAALVEQGRRRRRSSRPRRAFASRRPMASTRPRRLADRRRRRAQPDPRHAGPRQRRPGVPRSLPDRRHPHAARHFPAERWFWFDPPFHRNQSALLHRQADDVWRVDFQLGWDADPDEEKKPENILPRLRRCSGTRRAFDIEWASVYTFQCRRMRSFRHGRVLFVGDAAHLVSPFGARGANSGIQDVDNLVWKLELVLAGSRAATLLDSYDAERALAADENIRVTRRAAPTSSRRKAPPAGRFATRCWSLAKRHPFARALVNSGRLSRARGARRIAAQLRPTTSAHAFGCGDGAGNRARSTRRSRGRAATGCSLHLDEGFALLAFGRADAGRMRSQRWPATPSACSVSCRSLPAKRRDAGGPPRSTISDGLLAQRYDARPGTCYLFRPDQHVCARWRASISSACALRSRAPAACEARALQQEARTANGAAAG